MNAFFRATAVAVSFVVISAAAAADYPAPNENDFIVRDFKFTSGETMPELRLHYRTLGKPVKDAQGVTQNAVLIMHGTTGSGAQFIRPEFAGELFGPGQPLDATKFFIVLPDDIGHGKSSKPSDGMHAKFPNYGYRDMVEAEYRLLTEGLGINHARLIMGTSMGGMHTWLWGEIHPEFMDALMPLACLPTQISGRNRVWRRIIIDAIRNDPAWDERRLQNAAAKSAHGSGDALVHEQQSRVAPKGSAHPGENRRGPGQVRQRLRQDRGCKRCPLRGRGLARLRSRAEPGKDPRAAARDQFRRRPDQSAGARNSRARDQARAERARLHHSF